MSATRDTPEAPAQPEPQRCPRCGGAARPHKRRGAFANPFLPKVKTEITCEDCGLDFDPQTLDSAPRVSGQAPWSKP